MLQGVHELIHSFKVAMLLYVELSNGGIFPVSGDCFWNILCIFEVFHELALKLPADLIRHIVRTSNYSDFFPHSFQSTHQ